MISDAPPSDGFELTGKRVWVAGHRGMVGAAIVRRLAHEDCEILTVGRDTVDLRRQAETEDWMAAARPDVMFLAAGDNFELESSHVVPALLRKTHEAKASGANSIEIWGSGTPRREFLYVDDCADALVQLMKVYSGEVHVNVGVGSDLPIRELADFIAKVVGFTGSFHYDTRKPDGTPRKLLDVSRLTALGWSAETDLEAGLKRTYDWYVTNISSAQE